MNLSCGSGKVSGIVTLIEGNTEKLMQHTTSEDQTETALKAGI